MAGSYGGGATSILWSSPGDGVFDNVSFENAVYTPGTTDETNGTVILTISTDDPTGPCSAAYDFTEITVLPGIYVDAGENVTVCANNATIDLDGNISGSTNTGEWTSSGTGTFSPSEFDMAASYIPSSADTAAGTISLVLNSTNNGICDIVRDTVFVTITSSPVVQAGTDQVACANNADILLNGIVSSSSGTAEWSTSGSGSFMPNSHTLCATYIPSNADTALGGVTLYLQSTNNGGCLAVKDSLELEITPAPYVFAGDDQTVCANNANIQLEGIAYGATNTAVWSCNGTGQFVPDSSNLQAMYIPSGQDTITGTIEFILTPTNIGTCNSVSDTMILTIEEGIYVNAGQDLTTCANEDILDLSGVVFGNTNTGIWSSTGTGNFSNDTDLSSVYTLSADDTLSSSLALILESTNNALCLAVYDTIDVTVVKPGIYAEAGSDISVCANNASADLSGSISGGTQTGYWTTNGTGIFSPDSSSLSATYIPSALDTITGDVMLTLVTTNNGLCFEVRDSLNLEITPAPYVYAGDTIYVCITNPIADLNGIVSAGASQGEWQTLGTGTFSPDNTSLVTSYIPSDQDTADGSVLVILTSTDNNNCNVVSDTAIIIFTPAPTVYAGEDQVLCASNPVQFEGVVNGTPGTGVWLTNGTGTFVPDNASLDGQYIFSTADTTAGNLMFVLESTNVGGCLVERDTMYVDINSAPIVEAGNDISVCANNSDVQLNGSVTGISTTGILSGSGNGIFTPSDTTLDAVYIPDSQDTTLGNVVLYLTSSQNGDCNAVVDSLTVTITSSPIAEAGSDQIVCKGHNVNLDGSIGGGGSTGIWTSSGTGSFIPSDEVLNGQYVPSEADTSNGSVWMTLTSTNNGGCIASADSFLVHLTDLPVVQAGADQDICLNNLDVQLTGIVSGATSTGLWTTSGSGTFSPADTALAVSYIPSADDTAESGIVLYLTSTNACEIVDSLNINFTPIPQVNAGVDQLICIDQLTVNLDGMVSGATLTGQWSSSGDGYFLPDANTLNAQYVRSSQDSINASVYLTLSSTNYGNCIAVSDSVHITMTSIPVVNAGIDYTFCSNNADILLHGSVTGGASTGVWETDGSGTFSPSETELEAMYYPSSADTSNGFVQFILTSTDACIEKKDTVVYSFTPAPYVFAGEDQTVCANNADVYLNGVVSAGSTTGIWNTTGSGSFIPTNTNLSTSYIPALNDISDAFINLYLTSTQNGMCYPEYDTLDLIITPAPEVDAGEDQYVCNGDNVQLNGVLSASATTAEWTTTGTGTFSPDNVTLDAVYIPSAQDTVDGAVVLILTTTNNDNCIAVSDNLNVSFTPHPTVEAGADQEVCANNAQIQLSGIVSGSASTGVWTTSGTGQFVPDANTLNCSYIPSNQDTAIGQVMLTLTSTFSCPVSDSIELVIHPAPYVNAGDDLVFCTDNPVVELQGIITNQTTTGVWSTSGSGSFNPDNESLTVSYLPSSYDTLLGEVFIKLTSTNNGDCLAERDSISLSFVPEPIVYAGPDQVVCANSYVQFEGSIQGGLGSGNWQTMGTGFYMPNNESLNAYYVFSNEDTTAGSLQFILSTPEYDGCQAAFDTMNVTITPGPHVAVNADATVCANNSEISLSGTIWGATTTGVWTSSGTGYFMPSDTALEVSYVASQEDADSGSVSIELTT
ncbi:MAG: hypothetical protein C0594_10725, partial [Marinilabiliales bacterium]